MNGPLVIGQRVKTKQGRRLVVLSVNHRGVRARDANDPGMQGDGTLFGSENLEPDTDPAPINRWRCPAPQNVAGLNNRHFYSETCPECLARNGQPYVPPGKYHAPGHTAPFHLRGGELSIVARLPPALSECVPCGPDCAPSCPAQPNDATVRAAVS